MPGTWQYQQSARIPLNPPASLIRVKNLQSNACLINHKTVEHPLSCNALRAVWTSYKTGPRKQSRPFYRQMIRIQPTTSLTRRRVAGSWLVWTDHLTWILACDWSNNKLPDEMQMYLLRSLSSPDWFLLTTTKSRWVTSIVLMLSKFGNRQSISQPENIQSRR